MRALIASPQQRMACTRAHASARTGTRRSLPPVHSYARVPFSPACPSELLSVVGRCRVETCWTHAWRVSWQGVRGVCGAGWCGEAEGAGDSCCVRVCACERTQPITATRWVSWGAFRRSYASCGLTRQTTGAPRRAAGPCATCPPTMVRPTPPSPPLPSLGDVRGTALRGSTLVLLTLLCVSAPRLLCPR